MSDNNPLLNSNITWYSLEEKLPENNRYIYVLFEMDTTDREEQPEVIRVKPVYGDYGFNQTLRFYVDEGFYMWQDETVIMWRYVYPKENE